MRRARRGAAVVALALLVVACADPAPPTAPEPTPPTSASEDGVRVRVGGREVVVHCVLTCPTTETELTRLSADCLANPSSAPHRVSTGGALLTIGCCEEANVAYDRACGHEALAGCAATWVARCQGMGPVERPIEDDDRGVSAGRGSGR